MLNFALKYLKQGMSVIPLKPNGKEPLINWKPFQTVMPTEAQVMEWWAAVPNANIGIVTGRVSGIVVVDLDGQKGLSSGAKLGLTSSVVSLTGREGGGKHLWFKHPVQTVTNGVRVVEGVDVRGDGGYVVAPPSVHPSGRRYRFLTPFVSSGALPLFLQKLIEISVPQQIQSGKEEFKPKLDIAKLLEEMKDGNIDDTLFTVCSRLRSDGFSANDARSLLQPHATRVGAEAGHLDEKIENVWNRYEPRSKQGRDTVLYRPGFRPTEDVQSGSTGLTIHSPTNPDSLKQFEQFRMEHVAKTGQQLQTGYSKLDTLLTGGLKSSRLFTIAARTGVGKTNWLISVARSLCKTGKKVLLFSTEMPYAQIWERYIQTLENPEEFREHKLYVCDSFAPNIERVEEAIKQIAPDVFMFDHINHVSEEQRELGDFMQGLNYLRRKYDNVGIVTAQLNRSADWVDLKTGEKVTPRMSMIKGSGTIEQASSRVLLLSETRVTPEGTEIIGNLDKNDNGDKGLLHFMLTRNPYKMVEL